MITVTKNGHRRPVFKESHRKLKRCAGSWAGVTEREGVASGTVTAVLYETARSVTCCVWVRDRATKLNVEGSALVRKDGKRPRLPDGTLPHAHAAAVRDAVFAAGFDISDPGEAEDSRALIEAVCRCARPDASGISVEWWW